MVDNVALRQVFSKYLGFPCKFWFHWLLHIHHYLSSGAGTIVQLAPDVPSWLSLIPPQEPKKKVVQCGDRGRTESIVTWTPWQRRYTRAETTVQQNQLLHRKTDPSFIEEEAPFRNTCMPRREHKPWSWMSGRLKPGMTVLANDSEPV
jgi:hypothetical protein